MFYILFFFFIFSLHAAFQKNLQMVFEKPWLAPHLISNESILEYLKTNNDNTFVALVDYSFCGRGLSYLAQKKEGSKVFGYIDKITAEIHPQSLENSMQTLRGAIYYNGSLKISQSFTLDDFVARTQLSSVSFFIDKSGKLFKAKYNSLKKDWESPSCCGIFELGDKADTQFANCTVSVVDSSKSVNEFSLFLETYDGQILEMKIVSKRRKQYEAWDDLDDVYPRLFRTKEQLEEEIKTGQCDYVPQNFVKRQETIPFLPDMGLRFYLKFCKNPLWQSILWISLGGATLFLSKSRLLKSLSLLLTVGALTISNRKFLFKDREVRVYHPIEEIE